ncbi:MAG: hypothetical protein M3Y78_01390 [Pseudomonadota bacterium]|nr:hypothetical protein [Pseudomonadota bacterium]
MTKRMTGIVEKIDFTIGGAGNQWTTINGVRYATYWDIRTKDWKVGDRVEFEAFNKKLWANSVTAIPHAANIRKLAAAACT